jgi:Flp pilus assembly protein TadB
MWDLAKESMVMFLRGKLFADNKHAFSMMAAGMAVTAALFVVAVKLGVPLLVAAPASAFLGGCLQPRLYKNLKYR